MPRYKVSPRWENTPNIVQIDAGVHFGWIGKDIFWDVTSEMVDAPVEFVFRALVDKEKKQGEIDIKWEGTSKAVFTLFNPPESGSVALKGPVGVLNWDDKYLLAFMCQIDRHSSEDLYRLTYAFYDGELPGAKATKEGGKA